MVTTRDGFHYDESDLLVQRDGDGGDTLNRHGIKRCADYWLGVNSDYQYHLDCIKLEPYRGRRDSWVRHPAQERHKNPVGLDGVTRDQLLPNEVALGFCRKDDWDLGQGDRYRRLVWAKLCRFSRYQSGDPSGPHHWGVNIRGFGAWYFAPLLWVFDLALVVEAMIICFLKSKEPNRFQRWLGQYVYQAVQEYRDGGFYGEDSVDMDLNIFLMLRQAEERFPTLWSWLASMIYVHRRPSNLGRKIDPGAHPIVQGWLWYFRPETNASDFGNYMRPVIEEFIRGYAWKSAFTKLGSGLLLAMRQTLVPLLSFGLVKAVTR